MIFKGLLFLLGIIVFLAGQIMVWGAAYRRGFISLIACIFLPIVSCLFLAISCKESRNSVFISIIGFALVVTSMILTGSITSYWK
jgi:hypothetical protein